MDELSKLLGIAGGDDSLLSRHPPECKECRYFKHEPAFDSRHQFWCERFAGHNYNVTDKEKCIGRESED